MKLDFSSRRIFEKSLEIKFYENQFIGSRVVPCGRTDGRDKANLRFSQFCERAYKKRKLQVQYYYISKLYGNFYFI